MLVKLRLTDFETWDMILKSASSVSMSKSVLSKTNSSLTSTALRQQSSLSDKHPLRTALFDFQLIC